MGDLEDAVEALGLGLLLDEAGARDDHRVDLAARGAHRRTRTRRAWGGGAIRRDHTNPKKRERERFRKRLIL